jgi:hypothetical protein
MTDDGGSKTIGTPVARETRLDFPPGFASSATFTGVWVPNPPVETRHPVAALTAAVVGEIAIAARSSASQPVRMPALRAASEDSGR